LVDILDHKICPSKKPCVWLRVKKEVEKTATRAKPDIFFGTQASHL
jgi:hypothetical protein